MKLGRAAATKCMRSFGAVFFWADTVIDAGGLIFDAALGDGRRIEEVRSKETGVIVVPFYVVYPVTRI